MYKFNEKIEPLWVSRVHAEKGMEVKSHSHTHYYHMIYIVSGSFDFTINGRNYVLRDNMLTVARPGDIQKWINTHDEEVITYEVKFTVFDNDLKEALSKIPDIIYGTLFNKTLIEKIVEQMSYTRNNYQEYISVYLTALLYDLVYTEMKSLGESSREPLRLSPSQIVKQYIEDNYNSDLSLERIAVATKFNKSYLSTVFKKNEGITINEYIYRFRTYKSCELLAYSDLQLTSVSAMTGFKHLQHFCRTFKKFIGIPPGEYRNATPKKLISKDEVMKKGFNLEVLPVRSGNVFDVESETGYYRKKK